MKYSYSFSMMLIPLSILLVFASALLVQRTGASYKVALSYGDLKLLPQANVDVVNYFPDKPVEVLILYDAQDIKDVDIEGGQKNLLATLDSMRVKYDRFDINSATQVDFTKYHSVIVAYTNLDKGSSRILALMDWVEAGGRVLFDGRPAESRTFSVIYKKMGMISKAEVVDATGVEYKTDLIPSGKGLSLTAAGLRQTSFRVQLSENALVHIVSADANKIPLLWEYSLGKGRVVFINSDMFIRKEGRGIIGAAYGLLQDVFVYPVINGSVFFIDDFPSPITEGSTDLITKQYGMSVQDFYTNVWWPDVVNLSKKYNIKYTGVMIETYEDNVVAPFKNQLDNERQRYFGRLLLASGGELGLHGHNHVPLCLSETGVNQSEGYTNGWPTTESMQLSVYELIRFAKSIFPDNTFTTYVPPSNILCSDTRLWLPAVLPDLKVIASVYQTNEAKTAYEQEFTEASDGIIELPRVISGYDPTDLERFAALNELGLHYVNSHFVHPDDIMDPERGALKGWAYLRDRFEEYVKHLSESAPGLRSMTAREAAIAVQRFARLAMKTESIDGAFEIDLGNFYNEAWLMMRTTQKPSSIEGGTLTPVTSELYLIKALKPKVIVKFEGVNP